MSEETIEGVAGAQGNEIPGEREEIARAQGWSPEEEWKGPKDKWVDADTFLARGENIKAIMKERNAELARNLNEVRSLLLEQKDMAKKARIQGYQQALQEIQRKQRDAAATADVDAYDAAEQQKTQIMKEYQEVVSEVPSQSTQSEPPLFTEWKEKNSWYESDPDLAAFADGIGPRLAQEGYNGKALFDEITNRVKKFAPHKFGNPRRSEPGVVESGDAPPVKKKSGQGFDDLPVSAKQSYDRMAKQFKAMGVEYTKEEYLQNYAW